MLNQNQMILLNDIGIECLIYPSLEPEIQISFALAPFL